MNDDEQSKVLPTRHSDTRPDGGAMGSAVERQMRSSVPDTNSFNTRFMTNADGSTTRLRTRGGMCEYVTEQLPVSYGTTCKLNMDSGVVDLVSASLLGTNENDNASGILYRTQYVQQVVSGPVGGITGPVIGEIKPPKSAGTAPDNGTPAKSFIASEEKGIPYDKKRLTAIVPPSIFTGKMRMYVQALYGRHDHAEMLQLPTDGGGRPPMLYMDWSKKFGTEENPVTGSVVAIDTNSGIHTDPDTGEHTLICINGAQATFYKLNPSACARKLRTAMLDPTTPNGDKMRIEAYILSESRPDVAGKVVKDIGGYAPRYSSGYGWHFNYDGTKCDMVENSVTDTGHNSSSHYQLTFTKNSTTKQFSISFSIEEGPVLWKNWWAYHVLCYPDWGYGGLRKIGSASLVAQYGDAPFYVFYVLQNTSQGGTGAFASTMQSTRKVCRYATTTTTTGKGAFRTPDYLNPGSLLTFGADSFVYSIWNSTTTSATTVVVGGDSVVANDLARSESTKEHGSPAQNWESPGAGGFDTANFGPITYNDDNGEGVPDNCTKGWVSNDYDGTVYVCGQVERQQNGGPYDVVSGYLDDSRLHGYNGGMNCSWVDEVYSTNRVHRSAVVSAIPFLDSEAIYILGSTTETGTSTGTRSYRTGGSYYTTCAVRSTIGGPWTLVAAAATLGYFANGTLSTTETFTSRVIPPVTTYNKKFVCNYGTITDVGFPPSLGAFFDETDDVVPVIVNTISSASGSSVHSDDLSIDEGVSPADIDNKYFSFVGWA